ncbi:hypothetical protein H696_04952 [Fonticula alba]|uniref:Uncharacterized protein n=1 Tax=Fonticula alba TaxID=691883 RepID=A0A058Z3F0_FONAL|nr:hypothetical protein H696_04952 [Fonticula alba]KCV68661.1 hypothetical protein H696_04952 [Fonticula alba]|eukprot:XP_009497093.1 hypothetical protein H696_04952 [Fonticula alba]
MTEETKPSRRAVYRSRDLAPGHPLLFPRDPGPDTGRRRAHGRLGPSFGPGGVTPASVTTAAGVTASAAAAAAGSHRPYSSASDRNPSSGARVSPWVAGGKPGPKQFPSRFPNAGPPPAEGAAGRPMRRSRPPKRSSSQPPIPENFRPIITFTNPSRPGDQVLPGPSFTRPLDETTQYRSRDSPIGLQYDPPRYRYTIPPAPRSGSPSGPMTLSEVPPEARRAVHQAMDDMKAYQQATSPHHRVLNYLEDTHPMLINGQSIYRDAHLPQAFRQAALRAVPNRANPTAPLALENLTPAPLLPNDIVIPPEGSHIKYLHRGQAAAASVARLRFSNRLAHGLGSDLRTAFFGASQPAATGHAAGTRGAARAGPSPTALANNAPPAARVSAPPHLPPARKARLRDLPHTRRAARPLAPFILSPASWVRHLDRVSNLTPAGRAQLLPPPSMPLPTPLAPGPATHGGQRLPPLTPFADTATTLAGLPLRQRLRAATWSAVAATTVALVSPFSLPLTTMAATAAALLSSTASLARMHDPLVPSPASGFGRDTSHVTLNSIWPAPMAAGVGGGDPSLANVRGIAPAQAASSVPGRPGRRVTMQETDKPTMRSDLPAHATALLELLAPFNRLVQSPVSGIRSSARFDRSTGQALVYLPHDRHFDSLLSHVPAPWESRLSHNGALVTLSDTPGPTQEAELLPTTSELPLFSRVSLPSRLSMSVSSSTLSAASALAAMVRRLDQSHSLEEISLSASSLGCLEDSEDVLVTALLRHRMSMKSLSLQDISLSPEGCRRLLTVGQLLSLRLSGKSFESFSFPENDRLRLDQLSLSASSASPELVTRNLDALPASISRLSSLCLEDLDLTQARLSMLFYDLKHANLRSLSIKNCFLDKSAVKSLASGLSSGRVPVSISISCPTSTISSLDMARILLARVPAIHSCSILSHSLGDIPHNQGDLNEILTMPSSLAFLSLNSPHNTPICWARDQNPAQVSFEHMIRTSDRWFDQSALSGSRDSPRFLFAPGPIGRAFHECLFTAMRPTSSDPFAMRMDLDAQLASIDQELGANDAESDAHARLRAVRRVIESRRSLLESTIYSEWFRERRTATSLLSSVYLTLACRPSGLRALTAQQVLALFGDLGLKLPATRLRQMATPPDSAVWSSVSSRRLSAFPENVASSSDLYINGELLANLSVTGLALLTGLPIEVCLLFALRLVHAAVSVPSDLAIQLSERHPHDQKLDQQAALLSALLPPHLQSRSWLPAAGVCGADVKRTRPIPLMNLGAEQLRDWLSGIGDPAAAAALFPSSTAMDEQEEDRQADVSPLPALRLLAYQSLHFDRQHVEERERQVAQLGASLRAAFPGQARYTRLQVASTILEDNPTSGSQEQHVAEGDRSKLALLASVTGLHPATDVLAMEALWPGRTAGHALSSTQPELFDTEPRVAEAIRMAVASEVHRGQLPDWVAGFPMMVKLGAIIDTYRTALAIPPFQYLNPRAQLVHRLPPDDNPETDDNSNEPGPDASPAEAPPLTPAQAALLRFDPEATSSSYTWLEALTE